MRRGTEFGSTGDYIRAFRAVEAKGIHPTHRTLLLRYFSSPHQTVSWRELAPAAGYANDNAVKLNYGKLAHRIADELGVSFVHTGGFWLNVFAGNVEQ